MSSTSVSAATPATDEQLLVRIAAGEQAALGELFGRWYRALHALAAARLSDPAQIEDALYHTFITLWQKAGDFDSSQGPAYAWSLGQARAHLGAAAGSPVNSPTPPVEAGAEPVALVAAAAALRARILNAAVPLPTASRHVLPLPTLPAWLGWTAAAVFGFAALFFAAKSFNVRGELQAALDAERVSHLEASTLKNLLEAERILSRAQLDRLISAERLITELRAQAAPAVNAAQP